MSLTNLDIRPYHRTYDFAILVAHFGFQFTSTIHGFNSHINYDPTPTYTDLNLSVQITNAQIPTVHFDSSSRARGPNYGLSLYLYNDFVYVSSEGLWQVCAYSPETCRSTVISYVFVSF